MIYDLEFFANSSFNNGAEGPIFPVAWLTLKCYSTDVIPILNQAYSLLFPSTLFNVGLTTLSLRCSKAAKVRRPNAAEVRKTGSGLDYV